MSNKKHTGLTRRTSGLMALEQRFMFDGAAVDTAVDVLTRSEPSIVLADSHDTIDPAMFELDSSLAHLPAAMAAAQEQVRKYLDSATDEQLFALFNGGKVSPDAEWTQRLNDLRDAIDAGSFAVNVVEMDSASQFTAVARRVRRASATRSARHSSTTLSAERMTAAARLFEVMALPVPAAHQTPATEVAPEPHALA